MKTAVWQVPTAAIIGLVAVLVLLGCGSDRPIGETGEAPATSAGTGAPPKPLTISFEEAHQYPDGVEVAVTDITPATLGLMQNTTDETAKEGDPYTILTVRIHNGSTKELELVPTATLAYGPDRKAAGEVTLESQPGGMEILQPGEAASHDWGFVVPDEFLGDVVFEVAVGLEHDKTVFAGSIRSP